MKLRSARLKLDPSSMLIGHTVLTRETLLRCYKEARGVFGTCCRIRSDQGSWSLLSGLVNVEQEVPLRWETPNL